MMTSVSIAEQLHSLVDALRVDVGSRIPFPRLALYRTESRVWVFDTAAGTEPPNIDGFDPTAPWVAAVGGDVFTVETDTVPDLVVELVSRFQDLVIDTRGRGWPEIYQDGRFIGLAQPTCLEHDSVGWAVPGYPLIPFGSLPSSAVEVLS